MGHLSTQNNILGTMVRASQSIGDKKAAIGGKEKAHPLPHSNCLSCNSYSIVAYKQAS